MNKISDIKTAIDLIITVGTTGVIYSKIATY